MKVLLLILLVVGIGITFSQAYADYCDDPKCHAIASSESSFSNNYQGFEYEIEIPDLYVDPSACEDNRSIVTGWILLKEPLTAIVYFIENGITVGWIEDKCVQVESAYYGYNIIGGEGQVLVDEKISDPHGDAIGIEKNFKVFSNDNTKWNMYYGDSQGLDQVGPTLPTRNLFPYKINIGAEGQVNHDYTIDGPTDVNSQYSNIPSTRITDAKINADGTWNLIPTHSATLVNSQQGYGVDICSSGTLGVGASTEVSCRFEAVENTAPTISDQSLDYNGVPLIITLQGQDADKDYLKFKLISSPTRGTLDHTNTGEFITRDTPTSASLKYIVPETSETGSDSFKFSVTDGRTGHEVQKTITINVKQVGGVGFTFFEDFENGLGYWDVVEDNLDDTHSYDFWKADMDGEGTGNEGSYAYIRDCDGHQLSNGDIVGCSLELSEGIDITDLDNPYLSLSRYVDNIRKSDGEFFKIQVFNGTWTTLGEYDRSSPGSRSWVNEIFALDSYSTNNFKIKIESLNTGNTDYGQVDTIIVFDLGPPNKITDLEVTQVTTDSVSLQWTKPFGNGNDVSNYELSRSKDGGSFTVIQSNLSKDVTSFTDVDVKEGASYQYKLRSENTQGNSDYSNVATITIPLGLHAPVIDPIGDIRMIEGDNLYLTLNIFDVNGDALSYSVSGADFVSIDKVSNTEAILKINTDDTDAGTYTIIVKAYETNKTSSFDNEAFILTVEEQVNYIEIEAFITELGLDLVNEGTSYNNWSYLKENFDDEAEEFPHVQPYLEAAYERYMEAGDDFMDDFCQSPVRYVSLPEVVQHEIFENASTITDANYSIQLIDRLEGFGDIFEINKMRAYHQPIIDKANESRINLVSICEING